MSLKEFWEELSDDNKQLLTVIAIGGAVIFADGISGSVERLAKRIEPIQQKVMETGKSWPEVIDTLGDTLEVAEGFMPNEWKESLTKLFKGKDPGEIADYLQRLGTIAKFLEKFGGEFIRKLGLNTGKMIKDKVTFS